MPSVSAIFGATVGSVTLAQAVTDCTSVTRMTVTQAEARGSSGVGEAAGTGLI